MKWIIAGATAIMIAAGAGIAQPGNGNGHGPGNSQANGNGRGNSPASSSQGSSGQNANSARDSGARNVNSNSPSRNSPAATGNNSERGRPGNTNDGKARASGRADNGSNAIRTNERQVSSPLYRIDRYRPAEGCPPGLAKKYNGCNPPGQLRSRDNGFLSRNIDWWGFPRDGNYFYDSGYMLRLGAGGAIASYLPLLGGALAAGNVWPQDYEYRTLSPYRANYYGSSPGSYRVANEVVYRVDPETTAITSIAALLTGNDFTIGQPMPNGYEVYNVPPAYRSRYADGPSAQYRYSDGYIYQADPETRLIAAAIELLM